MKLTKQNVLDYKAMNELEQYVKDWVLDRWDDYDDKHLIFQEVLEHGCQSGIVSSLIYYSDTLKFFDTYREEIKVLLKDIMDESGVGSPKELFGDKWDESDVFVDDTQNQNLLAWFAFEETLRKFYEAFEDC